MTSRALLAPTGENSRVVPVSAVHPYEAEGQQVRARLREETGTDLDVDDFVADVSDAGLVAEVEGRPVPSPPPLRPAFPRLQPRRVRRTPHPAPHLALSVPAAT
ncbi:hypothetical protein [Nonomuraea wenchangensis]|uniref:Uncharacterized protein n=1 Tax=Nonomuraea wenchangensis TaxID=568860 RepID=A0A1I0GZ97_9ACTN|nr:hypothetical protein [Nonomuraea wenchangensis]SET76760.1 hypothetical protein SAMN05421811_10441 [Nonomuraea wenchangensis]